MEATRLSGKAVGRSVQRMDGVAKVTGRTRHRELTRVTTHLEKPRESQRLSGHQNAIGLDKDPSSPIRCSSSTIAPADSHH